MRGLALLFLLGSAAAEVEAARPVAKGAILGAADLSGPEDEVAAFLGKETRRPLFEGRRVRPIDVQEPIAVSRQATVTVLFERGALKLRTEGRALSKGRIGESVQVALPGRREPLAATVVAPGLVTVAG